MPKKNPEPIHTKSIRDIPFLSIRSEPALPSTKRSLSTSGRSSDLRFVLLSAPSRAQCQRSGISRISSPNTAAGLSPNLTEFPIKLQGAPDGFCVASTILFSVRQAHSRACSKQSPCTGTSPPTLRGTSQSPARFALATHWSSPTNPAADTIPVCTLRASIGRDAPSTSLADMGPVPRPPGWPTFASPLDRRGPAPPSVR